MLVRAHIAGVKTATGGLAIAIKMICFGRRSWNGRDAIMKERLFGLNGHEGNHGEDVKNIISTWTPRPRTRTCGCFTNIEAAFRTHN